MNTSRQSISDETLTWLGPAAEELSDDQLERFERSAADITDRYGDDPDMAEAIQVELSATVQWILGETSLEQVRDTVMTYRYGTRQIARLAAEDGISEAEIAARTGLNRTTVRKALGK